MEKKLIKVMKKEKIETDPDPTRHRLIITDHDGDKYSVWGSSPNYKNICENIPEGDPMEIGFETVKGTKPGIVFRNAVETTQFPEKDRPGKLEEIRAKKPEEKNKPQEAEKKLSFPMIAAPKTGKEVDFDYDNITPELENLRDIAMEPAAVMLLSKKHIEGLFGIKIQERTEFITCVNSMFIELNKRIHNANWKK